MGHSHFAGVEWPQVKLTHYPSPPELQQRSLLTVGTRVTDCGAHLPQAFTDG
jgi:hypothetical protein